ncbi:hypothetical protein [Methylosinus sp. RM1]|uniref:hypothetical protein n=1 Tax=Methylosinus sp. RM1 TaxID=2583817 RepID=UPI00140805CA|nr:hypothetical protein [Methylosinus sp. RM1]
MVYNMRGQPQRPAMSQSNYPTTNDNANAFAGANPCEILAALEYARAEFAMGKNVASIRFNGRQTDYHRGDMVGLTRLVAEYRVLCQGGGGRAIRAGGYHRNPYIGRPFGY